MLLSVYESTCCCSPSPTRAPQVPEAELDSLVARLAAEMVVSVELLRDCWSELKAALPAVARAKIGAALRAQGWLTVPLSAEPSPSQLSGTSPSSLSPSRRRKKRVAGLSPDGDEQHRSVTAAAQVRP